MSNLIIENKNKVNGNMVILRVFMNINAQFKPQSFLVSNALEGRDVFIAGCGHYILEF